MKNKSGLFSSAIIMIFSLLLNANSYADDIKPGKILGGVVHTAPDWFKQSFLEIQEDVEEATDENKHVLLFFQLNGCPYCDRMLRESFEDEAQSAYIKQHFDTIAINVKGDRDIAFNEELSVTEKELSEILKVRATPAIIFLNSNNKAVVRVNGYRAAERFKQILEYVNSKSYEQDISLADYLDKKLTKDSYKLRENNLFQKISDLSSVKGPLAIFLEDGACFDCDELHDNILSKADVQKELQPFTIVRINTGQQNSIIDVDGSKTTTQALAKKYGMIYRPGVLLFDQGKLIRRYDSLLFSFHFKEGFRFVSGGHYKNGDYGSYAKNRTEALLAAGVDIDLGYQ